MESYIIRIYRYDEKRPHKLVGTIKGINNDTPIAFSNTEELWKAIQAQYQIIEKAVTSDED